MFKNRLWLLHVFAALFLISLSLSGGLAHAQSEPADELGATEPAIRWDSTAKRAEEAITNKRASNAAMEALRAEVAKQRDEAFAIISAGNIETMTLAAQIKALGPAPKDGEAETPAIASRRAELTAAYDEANAPVLAARQAYGRAEVLLSEIDKIIRSRQQNELLQRAPSPLIPTYWPGAIAELSAYISRVGTEATETILHPMQGIQARQNAPFAIILAAIGLIVFFLLQPRLLRRVDKQANGSLTMFRKKAFTALALILRFALPLLGAALLVTALYSLNLTLYSARSLNVVAVTFAICLPLAYWLGHALFAPTLPELRFIAMSDDTAASAMRASVGLGGVLALEQTLQRMEQDYTFTPETLSVLSFVTILTGSLLLWRFASLLSRDDPGVEQAVSPIAEGDASIFNPRRLITYLMRIAAVAALVFSAIGYAQIARQAVMPTISTLGLIAFALGVYRLLVSASHAAMHDERAISALFPVAAGTLVTLASLPLLALSWGARNADISDAWTMMMQGVEVGGTRISFSVVLILVSVFIAGVFITRWLQRMLGSTILPRTRLDSGGRNAMVTGLGYVGIILSALIAVSAAGLDLSSLAIVAGALSVGIGFGLQAIVSNFISGIILLVERPVKEGDWIDVAGKSGIVRKIAVRSTRIETFDRHEVIVPNSDLITGTVTNMTLSSRTGRMILPVGVAYGSDLEKTRDILLAAARENKLVMAHPEPNVLFMGLGESSLDFELRCFLSDVYSVVSVRSELLFQIYRELGAAGIEIPFPQRDINLRNVAEIAQAFGQTGREKPSEA